ncbi:MCE family protein [Nocardioides sp.]|uniref:MCE family protein n=1 Tax=Nocardioides sp. TaxID=35761 RepID=UPI0026274A09|nr:MCE family protein [Nocardioides sp.]
MNRTVRFLVGVVGVLVVGGLIVVGARGLTSGWVYNANLPGGADVGSHPLTLKAQFADVLDLVPQSSVKVDNVSVGRVSAVKLNADGHSAEVTLVVNADADLPVGTQARLQQTSLLGEKYVALIRPTTGTTGTTATTAMMHSGDTLALGDTSAAAEVEQVLGALSMVLNGGGVGQFQEISRELQKISSDNPQKIRSFVTQLSRFTSTLNTRRDSITGALDGLEALSKRLDTDKAKLANALDRLSPGMQVMVDQRTQLTAMLAALDKLSTVTVKTLNASQDDIVADFKALDPILTQLARAGKDLPESLQILLTYPFPDSVLNAVKGDYMNVFVTTNFRTLPANCASSGCAWPQAASSLRKAPSLYSYMPVLPSGTASPSASGSSSPSSSSSSPHSSHQPSVTASSSSSATTLPSGEPSEPAVTDTSSPTTSPSATEQETP